MNIETGHLYFLKEEFFDKISDKYVKKDHETTQRPHYYALKDPKTSLFWFIPCSTQVDKYEKIIKLLRRGIKFTPTSPDIQRIEEIMLSELQGSC
jgi:hypothetical protein